MENNYIIPAVQSYVLLALFSQRNYVVFSFWIEFEIPIEFLSSRLAHVSASSIYHYHVPHKLALVQ